MQMYETIMDLGKTQQGLSQLTCLTSCNLEDSIRELKSEFPSCFESSIKTPEDLQKATWSLRKAMRESGIYNVSNFSRFDLILIVYFGNRQ